MLEKLFTSKNRIKIMQYLFFNKSDTYIREISRDLKMPVSAVKREIDNLILTDILLKDEKKIMLNKKSPIIEELKSIFVKTDAISYQLREALKDKRIKYAFLFGSFARGDYNSDSDVDLMVIGDIKSIDLYKKIKTIEDKVKREINPVVWSVENLRKQKNSGFVKDIFKKEIIMIKGEENEIRQIVKGK